MGETEHPGGGHDAPRCEVVDVGRRYGDVLALDRVSMQVDANEIVALVGPNGAGKTSLVRIIATLLRPSAGRVTVCGHDAVTDARRVRSLIAVVPQGAVPDPYATPWEHTYLYLRARGMADDAARRSAERVLDDLGLWDRRDVRAQELSGGYQRRILLAMALGVAPKLLLLDEPTTGLDPGARRQLWNRLAEARERTSILITTHDMGEAEILSDRIALISEGTLVAMGRLKDLLGRLRSAERVVLDAGAGAAVPGDVLAAHGFVEAVAGRRVVYPDDGAAAQRLVAELMRREVAFSVQSTTLEDVYFQLLREAGGGRPAPREP